MLIRILHNRAKRAILAVDADPNACLGQICGVEPVGTIAQIREKSAQGGPSSSGSDRVRSFEYGIQQAITEANGFDLLTMGRPEGPGCYCAANNLLLTFLDKLSSAYEFIVIDNEAGMEHLSRRSTNNVELLCIVADPTPLGATTAKRIFELAKQLPISVKDIGVILNRANSTEDNRELEKIEVFGSVPYDKVVFDASMEGKTIFDIEPNSPAFLAVQDLIERKLHLI
jgi:CO dehydrogenase maturation factor